VEKLLMARFDVYANPGGHAGTTPYLLDVQSDLFDGLDSRMAIPLRSLEHFPQISLPLHLTPVFTINGADFLLETPKMGAVPQRVLKVPVMSLATERDRIIAALDFLFLGY
jgi:toxin CcdB